MANRAVEETLSVASTQLPNVRTTTTEGVTVDLAGYLDAMFVAHIGTITDGTFAFDPEESNNGSDWTNVSEAHLSGEFANATSSADDRVQVVAYTGNARYVRCNLTVSGSPSTGGAIGVSVVRSRPRRIAA